MAAINYKGHALEFVMDGWRITDMTYSGEVVHEGIPTFEEAIDQIIHDTSTPAYEYRAEYWFEGFGWIPIDRRIDDFKHYEEVTQHIPSSKVRLMRKPAGGWEVVE